MSAICRETIENGFDLELRGEEHHFSLDTQDQLNLMKDDIITASGLLDERGDKVKVLDDKADVLSRDSNTYYKQAKRVKQAEQWRKYKMYAAIGCVALLLIYIIIGITCGFAFGCLSSD